MKDELEVGTTRCGDADRDAMIKRLSDAFVTGHISKNVLDARVAAASRATRMEDLQWLERDLPKEKRELETDPWRVEQQRRAVAKWRRTMRADVVQILLFPTLVVTTSWTGYLTNWAAAHANGWIWMFVISFVVLLINSIVFAQRKRWM